MSDFERRLSDALTGGAEDAPGTDGLAAGARRRLRARRQRVAMGGAAAAVVAVVVPVAVLGSDGDRSGTRETDRPPSALGNQDVTCGGASWPASAMEGGVPGLVDDAEVRAAFTRVLEEAPMDAPQAIREQGADDAPYVALAETDDSYALGTGTWTTNGPGKDADVVELERQEDGGLRMESWGDCQLRVAIPEGRSPVGIKAPRGGVDGSSTSPVVLATEHECTSGRDPEPFLGEPRIVEDEERVLVTLTSETVRGGADCQGNPSVPVTLDLDEPIGDRELLDGGTWPPTPLTVASQASWHTVEQEEVLVDVPGSWARLDTAECEFELVRFGPPGSDPCGYDGESLNFYGSATFDPAHGPGLREEADRWAGYAYAGEWAVYITAADLDEARRVLGSARERGRDAPDLSAGWRTESYEGLSIDVPAEWQEGLLSAWCLDESVPGWVERPGTAGPDVDCVESFNGHGIRFGRGQGADDDAGITEQTGPEFPEGSWAGVAIVPDASGEAAGYVQVVAPTEGLAYLIAGSLTVD